MLKTLYLDNNIIVIIKPVGFDSQHQIPELIKEEIKGDIFVVHRLDLQVAGVMVYARNKKAAAALSKCIQEGTMVKKYYARVHGTPEEKGIMEDLLFKDSRKNKSFVVKRKRKGVKDAKLEYVRLTSGNQSNVLIRLYTGRTHQIRVQFASRGFPLVGDHKYGSRDKSKQIMLYSCSISFPYNHKIVTFEDKPDWIDSI